MDIFTWEERALIDGVEFGIDYQLEVPLEDMEEYHRLIKRNGEEKKTGRQGSGHCGI